MGAGVSKLRQQVEHDSKFIMIDRKTEDESNLKKLVIISKVKILKIREHLEQVKETQ